MTNTHASIPESIVWYDGTTGQTWPAPNSEPALVTWTVTE